MNWLNDTLLGMEPGEPAHVGYPLLPLLAWNALADSEAGDTDEQLPTLNVVSFPDVSIASPDQLHGTYPSGTGIEPEQLLGVETPPAVTLAGVQPLGSAGSHSKYIVAAKLAATSE